LCSGVCEVTADEVRRFRSLLGYAAAGDASLAPTSMGLTYGLRLGWEHSIFPPGVVRMGDDDVFGVPARVGDRLTTTFSITERFEKKDRRFLRYEMRTINQNDELVCAIRFVGLMP
jgi:acyl dehydratase